MTITNNHLVELGTWLSKLELTGKESRVRTRFLKLASDRLTEVEKVRSELAGKYSKKNEAGKSEIVDGHYQFEVEDMVKFVQEFNEVLKEEFILDVTAGNKETLQIVKTILLNTEQKFSGKDALWYNDVCEIFEALEA